MGTMFATVLDLDGGMDIAKEAERLLAQKDGLRSILVSTPWLREQARVTALVSASAFSMSEVDVSGSGLEAVKAALDAVVTCKEGAIRHALATLIANDANDYDRLRRSNSGGLIKSAAKQFPGLFLDENLDPVLRYAGAHVDFDVDDRGVVTHDNRGIEIVLQESAFLDGVLGYLETAIALILAVQGVALDMDIDFDDRHLSDRDRSTTIVLMARLLGFESVRVELAGKTVSLTATGDSDRFSTLAAVIATIAVSQSEFIAEVNADARNVECRADLDVRRAHRFDPNADEQDLFDTFAPIMASTQIDGSALWSDEEWSKAAFVICN